MVSPTPQRRPTPVSSGWRTLMALSADSCCSDQVVEIGVELSIDPGTVTLPLQKCSWLTIKHASLDHCFGSRCMWVIGLLELLHWSHVVNEGNPADCGLFPSERHGLWWKGPSWLKWPPTKWPKNDIPVLLHCQWSRRTHWQVLLLRVSNCLDPKICPQLRSGYQTTQELNQADNYIYSVIQRHISPTNWEFWRRTLRNDVC